MLQQEYESISNEIDELEEKRKYYEEELKSAKEDDDIIECKFQIMKIKEALAPLYHKQGEIFNELHELKIRKEKQEINEKLFKKLYVTLDNDMVFNLKQFFKVDGNSKDEILTAAINECNEYDNPEVPIYSVINFINLILPRYRPEILDKFYFKSRERIDKDNTLYNKLEDETRNCIKYIEKNYDIIFIGIEKFADTVFQFQFIDGNKTSYDDEDCFEHPLNTTLLGNRNVEINFEFYVFYKDGLIDEIVNKFLP